MQMHVFTRHCTQKGGQWSLYAGTSVSRKCLVVLHCLVFQPAVPGGLTTWVIIHASGHSERLTPDQAFASCAVHGLCN